MKAGWVEVPELGTTEIVFFVQVFAAQLLNQFPELKSRGIVGVSK